MDHPDTLFAILSACTSKTRAVAMSVSQSFAEISLAVSRSLSATPQYYENTPDIDYKRCVIKKVNIKLICRDYHLVIRLNNKMVMDYLEIRIQGQFDNIKNLPQEYLLNGAYRLGKYNRIDIINECIQYNPKPFWYKRVIYGACAGGHMELFNSLKGKTLNQIGLFYASKHNRQNMFCMFETDNDLIFGGACAVGIINIVKDMIDADDIDIGRALNSAIRNNRVEVVKFIMEHKNLDNVYGNYCYISKNLDTIDYLYNTGKITSRCILLTACISGSLTGVKLAIQLGAKPKIYNIRDARERHKHIVKYLYRYIMGLIFDIYPAEEYSDNNGNTMPIFRQTPRTSLYDDTDYFKDCMISTNRIEKVIKYKKIFNYDRYGEYTKF
jgi:hypothetical protein